MAEGRKTKLSTSQLVCAIVQAVLTLVGFTICLVTLCQADSSSAIAPGIISVLMYALVIFYCVYGYKIPHGDLMKYVFLVFAFETAFLTSYYGITNPATTETALIGTAYSVTMFASSVMIAFMAGRLNRIKENEALGFMALILLVIAGTITAFVLPVITSGEFNASTIVMPFTQAILWGSLFLAYSIRFEMHKRAGRKELN